MKFPYTVRRNPFSAEGYMYTPYVRVVFESPDTHRSIDIWTMVDSGAWVVVLNANFAKKLHIDVKAGEVRRFYGIKGGEAVGYEHQLTLRLKNLPSAEIMVPCCFMEGLQTTALLGQQGFFEKFDVNFKLSQRYFELTPNYQKEIEKRF